MKKLFNAIIVMAITLCLLSLSACTPFDSDYGQSMQSTNDTVSVTSKEQYKNVKIPTIMSDDEVMPTFFDISLYDEENYADIYLGKRFKYNFTYAGCEMEVPTTYKEMTKKGWSFTEANDYDIDMTVQAGKSVKASFINEYNKEIIAVFYNSSRSSVSLKKCDIVKFIIPENYLNAENSVYGQFWINGVNNGSAITDVIEYLGAPSHFYAVSDNEYYLDYFLFEKDKRTGITVYINPVDDCVNAIEVSYY